MPTPNISESEWIVMEQLWERSPQTAGEIARVLKRPTGWAENTVRTLDHPARGERRHPRGERGWAKAIRTGN
jgi:hypothetical protein